MNLNEKVNEKLRRWKFGWTNNLDSLRTWVITNLVCSVMRSMVSWWFKMFLLLFVTFTTKFGRALPPSPCSFLFALRFQWSLNTSVHKISNAVCIFANLCSTIVCSSNFLQLGSIFYFQKGRIKAGREKLNVDRQFFKDAICMFWWYSV